MKHTRDDVIAEAEHFFANGGGLADLARQLGYASPQSLARVLHRAGRCDLASSLHRRDRNLGGPGWYLLKKQRRLERAMS